MNCIIIHSREPVFFSKYNNTLIGPGEAIKLPPISQQVDYEIELVVVMGEGAILIRIRSYLWVLVLIGRKGKNIGAKEAMKYVLGYTIGHDVSARDWQIGRVGGQVII